MNNIIVHGNIVRDAQVKPCEDKKILIFTVADNQRGDKTVYWDCSYFVRPENKIDQYLTKGKKVAVLGTAFPERVEKGDKTYFNINLKVAEVWL